MVREFIADWQWARFEEDGFLRLGPVMDVEELTLLGERIDAIMLGTAKIDYGRISMQLDRDPSRQSKPGQISMGHKGTTLCYRKIQQLEYHPDFLAYMRKPLMRDICRRAYGPDTAVACFRAMFMNKPAREGTELQWHQDRWTDLDRDPKVTIWAALNDATVANGCIKIIPRSHRTLLNPSHRTGFLSPEQIEEVAEKYRPVYLELAAGEAILLHNWTLHSSEINTTEEPRRAFSVCYMDAATKSKKGSRREVIFGEDALVLDQETSLTIA